MPANTDPNYYYYLKWIKNSLLGVTKNKHKMRIGMLVYVITKGGWAKHTTPIINLPSTSPSSGVPIGIVPMRSTTAVPYYNLPYNQSYEKLQVDSNQASNTTSGTITITTNGTGNTGNFGSNNIPNNNVGNNWHTITTVTTPVFSAQGYMSIKNYYTNRAIYIEQKDNWTEGEKESFEKSWFAIFDVAGKPFNGIIVDKFIPEIKSIKGEKVDLEDLGMPILCKVLFGEKNILWFPENELIPMKPSECLLKETETKE